jgi:pimeloyl-ACP methyl ester carboxylesterase
MKPKNSLKWVLVLVTLLALVGVSPEACGQTVTPTPLPSPDYIIEPSNSDGASGDCPEPGLGCSGKWGDQAANDPHLFYLPLSKHTGKLLVFFNGGAGKPNPDLAIPSFAASRGYHVIGLSYFAAGETAQINACDRDTLRLSCYGDFIREVLLGTDCTHETCDELNISEHPQDAAVNRLLKALEWAVANHPNDGWERYLTTSGEIDWTRINIAGWSNGSCFASVMGILFPDVGRVTLFSGPNDGNGETEDQWVSANYIQKVPGLTDTKYYGLVHELNKAKDYGLTSMLYRVTDAWQFFGMGSPLNPSPFYFDPEPGAIQDFGNAHMLISTNPTTDYRAAHGSVVYGRECSEYENEDCKTFAGEWIGYDSAWRCVLGTGNQDLNGAPHANAGEDRTVECEGGGGAAVTLDGSRSSDPDCDMLSYTWTGPFGTVTGRKPKVFLPVGTSVVTLEVSDGGSSSTSSDTAWITVHDTQPPSLQLTLSQTELRPNNHKLVRINATVIASDSCGGSAPKVVLTSITSNQPDNGTGDGDTAADIQEAAFGTFDLSFLLRAERSGNDPHGRIYTVTYTATDASGNSTQAIATVHVSY